jgi:hypothetical protein
MVYLLINNNHTPYLKKGFSAPFYTGSVRCTDQGKGDVRVPWPRRTSKLLKLTTPLATIAAMEMFISLIGMVLIFESLPYIAFPDSMRQWLRQLSEMETAILRIFGFFALAVGLFLCYLAQRTSLFS